MAITNGTNLSVVSAPTVGNPNVRLVMPTLRARDGSFVGTALDTSTNPATPNLVAFDASGNVRWSVPGYTPQIATADGGFIAEDPNTGAAVIFDRNGSVGAQIAGLPTYSWKGAYQVGSVESVLPVFDLGFLAQTYAAVPKGNLTGNGFSLVHHTFGLVFCGPEGDGACKSSYPVNTTPTSFSYLPVASLNDQTYNAQPPTGPVDFSGAHPDWVQTIRTKANDAYKAAFASLPAIVSQGWKANPISAAQGFEHTVYVTGKWYTGGDFGMKGEVIGETAGVGNCNNNGVYMGICATSNVYYLGLMGYAQQALQFLPPRRKRAPESHVSALERDDDSAVHSGDERYRNRYRKPSGARDRPPAQPAANGLLEWHQSGVYRRFCLSKRKRQRRGQRLVLRRCPGRKDSLVL
jgi:hypothetical protein